MMQFNHLHLYLCDNLLMLWCEIFVTTLQRNTLYSGTHFGTVYDVKDVKEIFVLSRQWH